MLSGLDSSEVKKFNEARRFFKVPVTAVNGLFVNIKCTVEGRVFFGGRQCAVSSPLSSRVCGWRLRGQGCEQHVLQGHPRVGIALERGLEAPPPQVLQAALVNQQLAQAPQPLLLLRGERPTAKNTRSNA